MNTMVNTASALALIAALATGCSSKDSSLPLTDGECRQMKEKQLKLMLSDLPAEYQTGFQDAKVEVKVDCDRLDKNARIQYECTMSSGTMKEFDQCRAEKYTP